MQTFSNITAQFQTTFISKLLAWIIASRIQDHLQRFKFHESVRSAYKRGPTTGGALLRVHNDLLVSVFGAIALVLLDIFEAFV